MIRNLLILDEKEKSYFSEVSCEIASPIEYVLGFKDKSHFRIYNLSSHMGYQEMGYYASLLGIARKSRVFPEPRVIQDLKDRRFTKLISEEISDLLQQKMKKVKSDKFELSVYFGQNLSEGYQELAWEFYRIVHAPMFRVYLEKEKDWVVKRVKLLTLNEISPGHKEFLKGSMKSYFSENKDFKNSKRKYAYEVAILVNSLEASPPSNKKALQNFSDAFKAAGFKPDFIEHSERPNLAKYDALFIRETTNVTHHTYRMARNAEKEGLVVVDDSQSIVKCTNKVFLEQLMERVGVKRPKTLIMDEKIFRKQSHAIKLPCVLKSPDSAFSQGVHKAKTPDELQKITDQLFKETDLILIQEFLPTEFDWRIGILNQEVMYACRYFMAKDHWQIVKYADGEEEGESDCIEVSKVDSKVLKTALKAANAIGSGLYGVDLKQAGDEIYLIEVNDNPSIEAGVEDQLLGKKLYQNIADYFFTECNKIRGFHV